MYLYVQFEMFSMLWCTSWTLPAAPLARKGWVLISQ